MTRRRADIHCYFNLIMGCIAWAAVAMMIVIPMLLWVLIEERRL